MLSVTDQIAADRKRRNRWEIKERKPGTSRADTKGRMDALFEGWPRAHFFLVLCRNFSQSIPIRHLEKQANKKLI